MMTKKQIEKWILDIIKEQKRVDKMMADNGPHGDNTLNKMMLDWVRRRHCDCQSHLQILSNVLAGKRVFPG